MCALDILSIGRMSGRLYRTKTLASGVDQCDFYICRKGSGWDKEKILQQGGTAVKRQHFTPERDSFYRVHYPNMAPSDMVFITMLGNSSDGRIVPPLQV